MRNPNKDTDSKKTIAKGKQNNKTAAANKSHTQKKPGAGNSIQEIPGEKSRDNSKIEVQTSRNLKDSSIEIDSEVKKNTLDTSKHICVLLLKGNINISNRLVASNAVAVPSSTKASTQDSKKQSLNRSKHQSSQKSTCLIGGGVPPKDTVSSKKATEPQLKSKPADKTVASIPKKDASTKVKDKSIMELTTIKSLLKVPSSTKASQTQKALFIPDKAKQAKKETKQALGTTSISIAQNTPKKAQALSHSILSPGKNQLSTGKNVSLSPKKEEPVPAKPQSEKAFPLTAAQALRIYADKLSDAEKGEILDYKEIFYMNKVQVKRDSKLSKSSDCNYGYDDDKGDYNAYVGDQIAYRYEIIDLLGKGSFGQAIKCFDHKTKSYVALKIIRSKKRFYHQATVEVKILKYITDNDPADRYNMIKMLDYFIFRKHIVLFTPLLSLVHYI